MLAPNSVVLLWIPDRLPSTKHGSAAAQAEDSLAIMFDATCAAPQRFNSWPQKNLVMSPANLQLKRHSPSPEWQRTECAESTVIFIQLLMHGVPARSLLLMLLHRKTGGYGGNWVHWCVDDIRHLNDFWRLEDKGMTSMEMSERNYRFWIFTKKDCMQMVTFPPLTDSLSILLLHRHAVVDNVFTMVPSPSAHYQWLTEWQYVSDIWYFQVQ